jgi:hypothetical protein
VDQVPVCRLNGQDQRTSAEASAAAGKLRVVLDPKLLVRTSEPSWVRYGDADFLPGFERCPISQF